MLKEKLHLIALSALFFSSTICSRMNAIEPYVPNSIPAIVVLQVRYADPDLNKERPQRSPVLTPEILIAGHTLLFNTSCDGCILRLLNTEGDEEYRIIIPGNTTFLELPQLLEGNYEIQIIHDNLYFYGDINLSNMD
jgi:hypothetical protein